MADSLVGMYVDVSKGTCRRHGQTVSVPKLMCGIKVSLLGMYVYVLVKGVHEINV